MLGESGVDVVYRAPHIHPSGLFLAPSQELQHSINKLHAMLLPWNQTKLTGQASVMKLIEAVDCLVYDEQSPQEKVSDLIE